MLRSFETIALGIRTLFSDMIKRNNISIYKTGQQANLNFKISVSIYSAGVKERRFPYDLNAQLFGEIIKVGMWTGAWWLGFKEKPESKESQTVE
jgi:hypothetical protein